ncbi:MAG TPA: M67 family metallopeptidase [Ktedonobacterales bacterium]|nr:M67 family metallopeptidase [Ktedonobacterales bacterium]
MAQDAETDTRRVLCGTTARDSLLADLAARPRIEACGLLLGTADAGGWRIEATVPLRNIANSATYFEFDPAELLGHDLRHGAAIVGVYHSHPGGPARPSATDLGQMTREAAAPWVWLILSSRGGAALGAVPGGGRWRAAGAGAFRVEAGALVSFPFAVRDAAAESGA